MLLVELTKHKKRTVSIHISCKEATALVDKRIKLGVIFDLPSIASTRHIYRYKSF